MKYSSVCLPASVARANPPFIFRNYPPSPVLPPRASLPNRLCHRPSPPSLPTTFTLVPSSSSSSNSASPGPQPNHPPSRASVPFATPPPLHRYCLVFSCTETGISNLWSSVTSPLISAPTVWTNRAPVLHLDDVYGLSFSIPFFLRTSALNWDTPMTRCVELKGSRCETVFGEFPVTKGYKVLVVFESYGVVGCIIRCFGQRTVLSFFYI